ncbi:thiamine transporter 1-like isoform X2 [Phlebotomus argentipes]|uniref:thiamine transporter 1-like isoform X2 n=1 Tax=Phlebotomus argentipes TaxID=94469 RepID=UPI002892BA75|nr:thiamine transporter 1-like isoform X2 [Phlebotomus argentipes]
MQKWMRISLLLCIFGFLKEIRPSEPFVTNFLLGGWRNITEEQVNRDVYPVGTYSYAAQLIIVFLITDFLKYKPLILVLGISGVIVWSLLLWTETLEALQVAEVFYGTYLATEVAYFTYIYAKVEKEHYSKVTSHTRAAILCGRFIAGASGQLLIFLQWMDYRELNYVTLGAQILATLWALFLPSVKRSVYFHRKASIQRTTNEFLSSEHELVVTRKDHALKLLWGQFRRAYTSRKVLIGSIWFIFGLCGYLQFISYVQILWNALNVDNKEIWNGAVEAAMTLLGAFSALVAGYSHNSFLGGRRSIFLLVIASLGGGLAIFMGSHTENLFVSYAAYLIFGVLYSFASTIASAEVANHLEEDSFGLVFGFNTFLSLVLQTILTLTVVTSIHLTIFQQFYVYATYFVALGVIYFAVYVWDLCTVPKYVLE